MNLETYLETKKAQTELVTHGDLPVRVKGNRVLAVLGAPYYGHVNGKDADGEYFSPRTEFMMDIGDKRPAVYLHGRTPRGTTALKPELIGKASFSHRDAEGAWFEIPLEDTPLADRVWEAAQDGRAKASSGAIPWLVRKEDDGELLIWPIGEMSVFDTGQGRHPANELARVELKSLFDNAGIDMPESFVKSGELKTELVQEEASDQKTKTIYIIKR